MIIEWRNHYVPEGQLEPDKFNRWQRKGYVYVKAKALEGFYHAKNLNDFGAKGVPVVVALIHQKGTLPGEVPSTDHRFCACTPTVRESLNLGVCWQWNLFGHTVQEVEQQVEQRISELINFFANIKT